MFHPPLATDIEGDNFLSIYKSNSIEYPKKVTQKAAELPKKIPAQNVQPGKKSHMIHQVIKNRYQTVSCIF